MLNIVKNRFVFYAVSAVIILIGIVMMFVNGFNQDVEFLGGTEISVAFGKDFDAAKVAEVVGKAVNKNLSTANVQKVGDNKTDASIKTLELTNEERTAACEALKTEFGLTDEAILSVDSISATVGTELKRNALIGAIIAVILMLIYISIRFEILSGCAAVCALIHDVLIMLTFYVVFRIPVDTSLIAALLTILGYSINATIVLFDRVRENSKLHRKENFENIINMSVRDTMGRSINTTLTTLVVLAVLWIMGVDSIKTFTMPIIVGVIAGFYSSVFLSGNFWLFFKKLRKDKNVSAN